MLDGGNYFYCLPNYFLTGGRVGLRVNAGRDDRVESLVSRRSYAFRFSHEDRRTYQPTADHSRCANKAGVRLSGSRGCATLGRLRSSPEPPALQPGGLPLGGFTRASTPLSEGRLGKPRRPSAFVPGGTGERGDGVARHRQPTGPTGRDALVRSLSMPDATSMTTNRSSRRRASNQT